MRGVGGRLLRRKLLEGGSRGKDGINVEFLLQCFVESIGSRMKGAKKGLLGIGVLSGGWFNGEGSVWMNLWILCGG